MSKVKSFLFLFTLFCSSAFAQFTEFHPELNWFTIKGKNVQVHYHEGAERTAQIIAKIGDEVWDPITTLYDYSPETVHYIVKDIDDYSNGATYFFENKIEIWASALDFDLRGTHNWLRNVISHEFTHLVQIQAALKAPRTVPAFFLQMMNYEDERRPDILYGYPNFIVSYPIAGINVPSWFAEGTAQYMRKEFNYEQWDSHRDMILRSYALDGNMLTWNEMGVFGKTSLGNESVYNSGFALTSYIAQKYGEDKLRLINDALGKLGNFTMDAAVKDVLGISGNELYNEWKSFLTNDYKTRISNVKENEVTGRKIVNTGFGNFYPTIYKNYIFYISNKEGDYFSPSSLYRHDLKSGKDESVLYDIRSTYSIIDSGRKVIYSKLSEDNKNSYNIHDLYEYDINSKDEKRLTSNLRANQPSVSNNERNIIFLFQKDGTTNLGIVDIDGKNFRALTDFRDGEQVYNPKFHPNDSLVIFDFSYANNRDVATINIFTKELSFLYKEDFDERNGFYDNEGNLVYSSDETGIFNLYLIDKSGNKKQLTNVTGGAFMNNIDNEGNIVYSGYTSSGYKIFYLTKNDFKEIASNQNYTKRKNPPLDDSKPNGDSFDAARLKNYNDKENINLEKSKYTGIFSKLTFFPFIRYDNYNTTSKFLEKLKPGVYLTSSDMLNKYELYAGGSLNTRMERDLFLQFNYRNQLPLLFNLGLKPELMLEVYSISRKANTDVLFGVDSTFNPPQVDFVVPADVTYNLFEFDIAARHKLLFRGSNIEFRFIYSDYTADLSSFTLPDEDRTLYPATKDTYLISKNFQVTYDADYTYPSRNMDINPLGIKFNLQYNYEMNQFNNEGEYTVDDNNNLVAKYNDFSFNRLELNTRYSFPLFSDHSVTTQLRAGSILGPTVPDFFDYYLGGLTGMKAYTFYAISGNELGWLNLTYRFPLFKHIDWRIGHLYLDKLYMSVYGDIGNAWNGEVPSFKSFKKGAGAELRVQFISFYIFPTSIFFNGAYGFDKVDRFVRGERIEYGKEWNFYGGILFGFDI